MSGERKCKLRNNEVGDITAKEEQWMGKRPRVLIFQNREF